MRKVQKNNKEFDEKYNTLKNRIEILKREEEIYKNQLNNIKRKEEKEHMIQVDKMKIKFELTKIKEEKDKELQKRKERIHRFKEKTKNNLEEKRIENISKKKRKYQSALNDKYLIRCIIEQINNQQNNKKCYQHEKIKQYYNEYETNKIKKNLMKENKQLMEYRNNMRKLKEKERKMKKKCDELISQEKKYLEKLNETKENNLRYIENTSENLSKYSYKYKIKGQMRNLNRSVELESYSKKINDVSKSAISYSIRNIKSKIDKKENLTENTQSSSKNIYQTKKEKQISKNNNSAIKGRNRCSYCSYLNDNKSKCKSVVNIKENSKNNKIFKTFVKENIDKTKEKNNGEKKIFRRKKNVEKFLTKK